MTKALTIFAIDDEPAILYTLRAMGEALGWKVITESDSIEAVRILKDIKPDLILVDYQMPKQDGLATVEKIRENNQQIPIIVLTISDSQELANKFLAIGASDFATKPIKIPDLVARIKVHIKLLRQQKELVGKNIVNKEINMATLELVKEECALIQGWFHLEDISKGVNLSYQTIARYLQYLVTKDYLAVENDYGKVGRPRNKYKMKNL